MTDCLSSNFTLLLPFFIPSFIKNIKKISRESVRPNSVTQIRVWCEQNACDLLSRKDVLKGARMMYIRFGSSFARETTIVLTPRSPSPVPPRWGVSPALGGEGGLPSVRTPSPHRQLAAARCRASDRHQPPTSKSERSA